MGYELYKELYRKGSIGVGEGCVHQARRQNSKCMCEESDPVCWKHRDWIQGRNWAV